MMKHTTLKKKLTILVFLTLLSFYNHLFGQATSVLLNATTTLTAGTNFTCGATFFDNGGAVGDYAANADNTITLCAAPGQYLRITLSLVAISSSSGGANLPDFFTVNTGAGFTTVPNTGGSGPVSVTYESTVGGCISFRLDANPNGTAAGFAGTIACITPPTNDNVCSAIALPVSSAGCVNTLGTTVNSTLSTGMIEPGCGSFSNNDVWYSAVVPANGILSLSVVDNNTAVTPFVSALAIYTGTCTSLTHNGCNSSASYTTPSTLNYTGTPGETVYIRVWDYLDGESTFNICATTTAATMGSILTGSTNLTCGGTFTDPGGNGNYLTNQMAVYTICPSTPGQYASVNFSSFSLGSGDALTVMNGTTSGSAVIGNYTGTTLPPTITSSDPSGCLTFAFLSNTSGVSTGWAATVSCSATPGTNSTGTCSTSNCIGGCGVLICGDGNYPTNNNVTASVEELATSQISGCFGGAGEVSTTWFYFQAQTAGTLEITLNGPSGQDYDFSVYGPSANQAPCPSITGDGPIRCSFSGAANPVGIGNGATDYFEDGAGNGWVAPINMQAGEVYAMALNIYQNGGPQPVIGVDIAGSGSLDCTPTVVLPITLLSFDGIHEGKSNYLTWITNSEVNNDYFTLERSANGTDWEQVGIVQGSGTTNESHFYSMRDLNPYIPISYYRLIQTDYDGQTSKSKIISINANGEEETIITSLYPNPSGQHATFTFNGSDTETPLSVRMFNALGEIVQENTYLDLFKGMPSILRTNELMNGMYQVEFIQGEWKSVQKLTVIR